MYEEDRPRPGSVRRTLAVLGRPEVMLVVGLLAALVSLGWYLATPSGGPSRLQLFLLLVAMAIYFRLCFRSGWS